MSVIVGIENGSDGDPTHLPPANSQPPMTQLTVPTMYLEKLAVLWMAERGQAQPGLSYVLDRLPAGYSVWGRPRQSGTNAGRSDWWLFGHPAGKRFDSPNRFFPHFLCLMQNGGDSSSCTCTVCEPSTGKNPYIKRPAPKSSPHFQDGSTATPRARPPPGGSAPTGFPTSSTKSRIAKPSRPIGRSSAPVNSTLLGLGSTSYAHIDDEGTPDPYRQHINQLRRKGQIDEPIREPMSFDWRCEQKPLLEMFDNLKEQPAWAPRVGEIVLFARKLPQEPLEMLEVEGERPIWEAGVVGQVAQESLNLDDLVRETPKKMSVNYSGFRVEPMPDPNSDDKRLSQKHKYVPLHHIRPFIFCDDVLRGVDTRHPTIQYARSIMSSFSLLHSYRFKGTWPSASIFCRGVFVGSELILVDDVVRLMPRTESDSAGSDSAVSEVMQIKSIQMKLSHLDESNEDDYDDKHPYHSALRITGRVWRLQSPKSMDDNFASPVSVPEGLASYGTWSLTHAPDKQVQLPFHRILSRLYSLPVLSSWCHSPTLSTGLSSLRLSREYFKKTDRRISLSSSKSWYWGDYRADSLALHTFNGVELSCHDDQRDPREWRKMIKVIEGAATEEDVLAVKKAVQAHRPLRSGMPGQPEPDPQFQSAQESEVEGHMNGLKIEESRKRALSYGAATPDQGKGKQRMVELVEDSEDELMMDEPNLTPKGRRVSVVID